jgi:hypothetical protein
MLQMSRQKLRYHMRDRKKHGRLRPSKVEKCQPESQSNIRVPQDLDTEHTENASQTHEKVAECERVRSPIHTQQNPTEPHLTLPSFNLAPTTNAQPLAAYTKTGRKQDNIKLAPKRGTAKAKPKASSADAKPRRKGKEVIEGYGVDDTPRAFQRLINQQTNKRHISGLDEGEDRRAKKAKTSNKPAKENAAAKDAPEMPKIQPGERMSDYNARVDQAIKISGLIQKGKAVEGIKERRTKKEKQMHKLYATWREEEEKIKEQREEAREKQEELDEENAAKYGENVKLPGGKRARAIGESDDKEGDIWASLKEKRGARPKLNDVVQAPPELVKPKEKFKPIRGARVDVSNVPNKSGSLMKREELGDARREVIERYRAMMKTQRGEGL